ncbi:MAG: DNA polymerase III subunit delta [Candidatus Acidiferrales bacterium]
MPQATVENLLQRIEKGQSIPAIVLHGADPYLRDQCRNALVAKFISESARDWAVSKISATGGGLQELLQRAQMAPMLSPRQVLILQDTEALERGGDEALERTADALSAYLEDPAPFSIVVFEAEQLDRRKKLFKTLAAGALIVELSADVDPTALALHMARELGANITSEAASELADAVNGEPAKIRLELEKLLLYATGRQITAADVDALVVSAKKYTVWKLAEAFAARDRRASMEFLDSLLREGEQPAGIVGALSWMYRKLVEARELPAGTNQYSAARDLGMRPETAAIALAQARKIPREQLLAGIAILAEADSVLKSGAPNSRATLEFVLARLTSSGAGVAA